MNRRAFERLVRRALRSLPPAIGERLENVDILVEDWPDSEHLRQGRASDPHSLLGLYEGVPLVERAGYGMVLPDRITIFRKPILALA